MVGCDKIALLVPMLEKPDLPEHLILSRVQAEYGLPVAQLTFLPLGADFNTVVYRAVTPDSTAYFLKLRRGPFDETTVTVPQFLRAQGIQAIIAPLETNTQKLWASFGDYTMILYPFIEGKDGYQVELTDHQWVEFGSTLKAVHAAQVPSALRMHIPQESFSPHWRELVRKFQAQVENTAFTEPTAVKLAAFMHSQRSQINHVVGRAEQLARQLQARSLDLVLCHTDIHAGNLLICPDGTFYIVDWDNPALAPKEHDLTLIGGSSAWNNAQNSSYQETLFFQGYGPGKIDRMVLTYYRYERIVQDMAEYCKQLLLTDDGGEDREQGFTYFASNFLPDHEIELARRIDDH
jgi:spectinomycin phosphotransferase